MDIYKELYYHLFNSITDAVGDMERMNFGAAKEHLLAAQQDTEERYLSYDDSEEIETH